MREGEPTCRPGPGLRVRSALPPDACNTSPGPERFGKRPLPRDVPSSQLVSSARQGRPPSANMRHAEAYLVPRQACHSIPVVTTCADAAVKILRGSRLIGSGTGRTAASCRAACLAPEQFPSARQEATGMTPACPWPGCAGVIASLIALTGRSSRRTAAAS